MSGIPQNSRRCTFEPLLARIFIHKIIEKPPLILKTRVLFNIELNEFNAIFIVEGLYKNIYK
ncbi:hypothetical protein NARC_220007 [Candidatus Nitrosocosmicus arcticus]|uniref:Uncharacterized protein n=1 Tax=Candidatus Nitrosocosmicus arcticus TaxID=2035267 RepID=A0A557SR04_9ARCH|nr:hypothetical protein NARC_220007 [Candidatus Nitrosocosmicus arcticus]